MQIKITSKDKGQRLDKFLVSQLDNLSRSQIQKAIQAGQLLVNGQKNSKHYFLNENDIININIIKKITNHFQLKPNKNIKFNIIFENENYLVVNKPAHLIVHPGNIHKKNDTLINGIIAKYPEIIETGEGELRPGIVHRLDKEVSGLLVVAKTQAAFLNLKKQFQDREVYKEYIALVHGKLSKQHDIINFNIGRSKTNGSKMAAKPDSSGRQALTEYEVLKEYNNYSLLKIIIHTGRTHQIRVHLNAIGHPIIGDQIYKPKSLKSNIKLDRIFLHAHKIKFKNLEDEILDFVQEIPEELKDILKKFHEK